MSLIKLKYETNLLHVNVFDVVWWVALYCHSTCLFLLLQHDNSPVTHAIPSLIRSFIKHTLNSLFLLAHVIIHLILYQLYVINHRTTHRIVICSQWQDRILQTMLPSSASASTTLLENKWHILLTSWSSLLKLSHSNAMVFDTNH